MKSQLKYLKFSDKKGFVQVDFLFAISIFFIFFYFVFSYYYDGLSSFRESSEILEFHSNSKDICYSLVSQSGIPNNWESDIDTLEFIGLKETTSKNLSSSKIAQLTSGNYFTVLDSLNISGFLYLKITGIDTQTNYLDFGVRDNLSNTVSSYTCFSNYNSEPVKVFVEVWK